MAIFDLSSNGRTIVINEGSDDVTAIRTIFMVVTLLLGLLARFLEALIFWSLWLARKKSNIITILYVVYVCNGIIHTVHYVDNIGRPVYYYEPKWLYQKYLLSTMEITFYVNFPITFVGKNLLLSF